ncbi:cannabinoid receptor 1 [Eurytemora carolleeae]|uniref:cannabinoid receptor 1 n=1 Tax=Eurytemora carolleeae TaxID=1294199 RepID=UPI000C794615|nr:cannabinoid receptor 1 [Eurytemora carolleeae]|eukprot:XP_023340825.1 cannabinoid receptor 1-like [Eurytemora affinis]
MKSIKSNNVLFLKDTLMYNIITLPNIFSISSVHHILLLTVDRFIALVTPLFYTTSLISNPRFMFGTILFIWTESLVVGLIPILASEFELNLMQKPVYNYMFIFIFYGAPILIIVILYAFIFYEIHKWRQKYRYLEFQPGAMQIRGAMTTFAIVLLLLLSYVPNLICWFLHIENPTIFSEDTYSVVSILSNMLKTVNTLVNPIVYSLRMKTFKSSILKIFRKDRADLDPGTRTQGFQPRPGVDSNAGSGGRWRKEENITREGRGSGGKWREEDNITREGRYGLRGKVYTISGF